MCLLSKCERCSGDVEDRRVEEPRCLQCGWRARPAVIDSALERSVKRAEDRRTLAPAVG
jgi:hypothetical protein